VSVIETVPPDARTHREEFEAYVLERASPWHRKQMGQLYREWDKWNKRHFDNALVVPYLLMTAPANPKAYGDYGRVSCFGGVGQTRIRPTLLTGEHPHMRPGDRFAKGRYLFVADVFLHESVHQFQHEVMNDLEPGCKGHGPRFADKCNAIGAVLGLPPVGLAKEGRRPEGVLSCAEWPHCVRPAGYYQGAYIPEEERKAQKEDQEGGSGNGQPDVKALLALLFDAARRLGAIHGEYLEKLLPLRQGDQWVLPPCGWAKMLLYLAALVAYLEERDGIRPSREQPADPAATILLPFVSTNGDNQKLTGELGLVGTPAGAEGGDEQSPAGAETTPPPIVSTNGDNGEPVKKTKKRPATPGKAAPARGKRGKRPAGG
jgi:hypothetical protein